MLATIFAFVDKWSSLAIGASSVVILSWLICKHWEPQVRKLLASRLGASR
jgi:hypothetical protein